MFSHIYQYVFKNHIRVKELMFWNMLFPIVLAVLIYLTVGNVEESNKITKAVVCVEDESVKNVYKEINKEEELFELADSKDPEKDIKDEKIDALIQGNENLKLLLGEDMVKSLMVFQSANVIQQNSKLMRMAVEKNGPEKTQDLLTNGINFESKIKSSEDLSSKKMINAIYYTILGMVALGATSATISALDIIDLKSIYGLSKRMSIVPYGKIVNILAVVLSSLAITLIQLFVVSAFMYFALKVNIIDSPVNFILASVVSSLMGVSLGAVISLALNVGMDQKIGIGVGVYMMSSFMAGMMQADVRLVIAEKLPLLDMINPSTIIYKLYASIYYFESNKMFFDNLLAGLSFIAVMGILCVILVRGRENEYN